MLQDIIEGLRILVEYDSELRVELLEGEMRIKLHTGIILSDDDIIVLKEFGWRESEGDWVRWV